MRSTTQAGLPGEPEAAVLSSRLHRGLLLGAIGVLCFSVTLPATRICAPQLGAVVVGLGRAIIAAALAAMVLIVRHESIPARRYWGPLLAAGLGIVIGFPYFTALALRTVPSVHGAVVVGFLPAATAIFAVMRGGERPRGWFWFGSMLGLIAVVAFALAEGAGRLERDDVYLLLAVASAGFGYAEGARISRELGGWRVISWALVGTVPLVLIPVALAVARSGLHADLAGWIAFAYVAVVSMFLGFFAWYEGLAVGGIARVAQLQLAQPGLTLLWSALFLGERVTLPTAAAATLVVASAAFVQRSR